MGDWRVVYGWAYTQDGVTARDRSKLLSRRLGKPVHVGGRESDQARASTALKYSIASLSLVSAGRCRKSSMLMKPR